MDEMKFMFMSAAISALGQKVAMDYAEMINSYPGDLRPIVVGQLEAFVAGTKSTFSEKDKMIADRIRDTSRVVTVLKKPEGEDES